ncbi:MAG: exodeoxyribonuclease VII small subunit [Spirochaetaceae bacterium]|nr:MAG: exodeoxyribonuclease VII small subunit [Spirochaetaceae bacterium]
MKSFEERLEQLEEIAARMRSGELPLDDAVKEFEAGINLARGLEKDLAKIEKRVEILVNKPGSEGEKPVLELFPELDELSQGAEET